MWVGWLMPRRWPAILRGRRVDDVAQPANQFISVPGERAGTDLDALANAELSQCTGKFFCSRHRRAVDQDGDYPDPRPAERGFDLETHPVQRVLQAAPARLIEGI